MRKIFSTSGVACILLVVSITGIVASHKSAVLGEMVAASDINFPPVTAGPGLILPDSPLYFLDHAKQAVRLFLAITPESKARIHMEIAGERLAEVRIMMKRNNAAGIDTALHELSQEVAKAASSLSDAAAQGKDVKKLARVLNDTFKVARTTLDTVANQAGGDLRGKVRTARASIVIAKAEVEQSLPQNELSGEVREDMKVEIAQELEAAQEGVTRAEAINVELDLSKTAGLAIHKAGQEVRAAADAIGGSQEKVAGVASKSATEK